jgi:hypothetical protein
MLQFKIYMYCYKTAMYAVINSINDVICQFIERSRKLVDID